MDDVRRGFANTLQPAKKNVQKKFLLTLVNVESVPVGGVSLGYAINVYCTYPHFCCASYRYLSYDKVTTLNIP
jgi:hypothetical protein